MWINANVSTLDQQIPTTTSTKDDDILESPPYKYIDRGGVGMGKVF